MITPIAWMPGAWELILILGVFLLLFGGAKLPKLARSLGSSMTEFKKGLRGEVDEQKKVEDQDAEESEKTEKSEKSEESDD